MAVIYLPYTYIYKYMSNAIQYMNIINIHIAMQTKLGLLRVAKFTLKHGHKFAYHRWGAVPLYKLCKKISMSKHGGCSTFMHFQNFKKDPDMLFPQQ